LLIWNCYQIPKLSPYALIYSVLNFSIKLRTGGGRSLFPGSGDCNPIVFLKYVTDETLDLIDEEGLTASQSRGLVDALERAIADIESGKLKAAEGVLNSFIGKLSALINKGAISAEDGQPLIDQVQMLIDTM